MLATFKKDGILIGVHVFKVCSRFGVDTIDYIINYLSFKQNYDLKGNLLDTEELSMYLLVLSTVIRQVNSLRYV